MKVYNLRNPYPNGFLDEQDPVAVERLRQLKEVYDAVTNGSAFVRYIDGDRKGSIARVRSASLMLPKEPTIEYSSRVYVSNAFGAQSGYRFLNDLFQLECYWDGRRNKVKESAPCRCFEFLLDYDGPTVWQKFDAKAAKEQALEDPGQFDVRGNQLNVGDDVVYMNLRYGQGGQLDFGKIKEFKVSADSKRVDISTVVEREDGELSTIRHPSNMIWKIPK